MTRRQLLTLLFAMPAAPLTRISRPVNPFDGAGILGEWRAASMDGELVRIRFPQQWTTQYQNEYAPEFKASYERGTWNAPANRWDDVQWKTTCDLYLKGVGV